MFSDSLAQGLRSRLEYTRGGGGGLEGVFVAETYKDVAGILTACLQHIYCR